MRGWNCDYNTFKTSHMHSTKTHAFKKINSSLRYYLPVYYHILWPKRLRTESTHTENWPKRPNYQGRNDPPLKLAVTTQAKYGCRENAKASR